MSNTQFLDLDAVTPIVKKVKLHGVEYTYHEPTVQDFAAEMRRLEENKAKLKELEGLKDEDQREIALRLVMEEMIASIKYAFPDMGDDVLQNLTLKQATAITEFTRGKLEEVSEKAEDAQGNA